MSILLADSASTAERGGRIWAICFRVARFATVKALEGISFPVFMAIRALIAANLFIIRNVFGAAIPGLVFPGRSLCV